MSLLKKKDSSFSNGKPRKTRERVAGAPARRVEVGTG